MVCDLNLDQERRHAREVLPSGYATGVGVSADDALPYGCGGASVSQEGNHTGPLQASVGVLHASSGVMPTRSFW